MDTTKIFIVGNYGLGNLGDELVLSSIIHLLRTKFKKCEITVLSFDPKKTISQHDVNSVLNKPDPKNLIIMAKEIYKNDVVICGGGGILMVTRSIIPVLYYFIPIYIAKIFSKPIFFYGVGAGPIDGKLGKFVVKVTCNLATAIWARDEVSKELLLDIDVKKSIDIVLDPAIFYTEFFNISRKKNTKSRKPIIGISIVPWGDKRYPCIGVDVLKFEEYKRNIVQLITCIVNKVDAEIILVPMKHPSDTVVIDEIINSLPGTAKIKTKKPKKHELSELISIFKDIDLFIGCRLHSIILSTTMNIPTIAIAYHEKVNSYMKLLEEEDKVIEITNFNPMNVCKIFEEIWIDHENIAMNLKKKIEEIRKDYKNFDLFN